jgi:hypothetical protein
MQRCELRRRRTRRGRHIALAERRKIDLVPHARHSGPYWPATARAGRLRVRGRDQVGRELLRDDAKSSVTAQARKWRAALMTPYPWRESGPSAWTRRTAGAARRYLGYSSDASASAATAAWRSAERALRANSRSRTSTTHGRPPCVQRATPRS